MDDKKYFESIPCPICGNKKLEKLAEKGQFGMACHVSICPSDGLVFLNPRWSKERYDQFYQNEYDTYYRPEVFSDEPDNVKYNNIKTISSRIANLNLLDGKKSVLDAGAGMGWSLEWLKLNYPQFQKLSAIESSKYCISNLKDVVGANVLTDNFDSDWKSTNFDIVIMRHVLEHLMDPVESMRKVEKSLAQDGIVYLAVPDMMNPKGSLKNYWFRTVHTFYFSETTLATVTSMANLDPIEINSSNSEIYGIFKKTTKLTQNQDLKNVYEKQVRIIKAYQRRNILLDIKQGIIQKISNLLFKK